MEHMKFILVKEDLTTSNASQESNSSWLDRRLPPFLTNINMEKVIFAVIIILGNRQPILYSRCAGHESRRGKSCCSHR